MLCYVGTSSISPTWIGATIRDRSCIRVYGGECFAVWTCVKHTNNFTAMFTHTRGKKDEARQADLWQSRRVCTCYIVTCSYPCVHVESSTVHDKMQCTCRIFEEPTVEVPLSCRTEKDHGVHLNYRTAGLDYISYFTN